MIKFLPPVVPSARSESGFSEPKVLLYVCFLYGHLFCHREKCVDFCWTFPLCRRKSLSLRDLNYYYYYFLLFFLEVKVLETCYTNTLSSLLLKVIWETHLLSFSSVQFSSVAQSCPTLCDPMNRSTPGLSVHHQLSEFTQTHVHWVCDAIQPSHPLLSPFPPAPNSSQHQSFLMSQLFTWGGQSTVIEFTQS